MVVAPSQPNNVDDMHIHWPSSSSWTMYLIISQGGIEVREIIYVMMACGILICAFLVLESHVLRCK
jgi:hypothetical protein